jgi:hypothetical protein
LSISWDEVCKIDEWVFQFIDLIIIGDRNIENLKRYEDEDEIIENCQYLLELVDNTFWEISSKDLEFLNRVKKAYL